VYEINSKILFLADMLFLGGCHRFGKYILPWQAFFCGGYIGLESPCIQVNMICGVSFHFLLEVATISSPVQQCPCIS
jgi:hypothetical protein